MPMPSGVVAVQTNWTGLDTGHLAWEQANANFLSSCVQEIQYSQTLMMPALGSDTCRLICSDPTWAIVPGMGTLRDLSTNPLFPYVVPGVRMRVLEYDGSAWQPQFFGYATAFEPEPLDEFQATVTITLESPLARLARKKVTLQELPAGSAVWATENPSLTAAWRVFFALGLAETPFVQLDPPRAARSLPRAWGGGEAEVGATLRELLVLGGAILACEPQYAVAAGDPDYVLHWFQPSSTATLTWANTAGDLDAEGASVVYSEETP